MANNPTVPGNCWRHGNFSSKGYLAMSSVNTKTIDSKSGDHKPSDPSQPTELPKLISTKEAGKILDSSSNAIRKLIGDGKIKAYQIGRNLKVDRDSVIEFMRSAAVQAGNR
jgi:excisionase family DNA binding protein